MKLRVALLLGFLLFTGAFTFEKIFPDQTTRIVGTPEVFIYTPTRISTVGADSVYGRLFMNFMNTDTVDYDSLRIKLWYVAYPFSDAALQAPTTVSVVDTFYLVVPKASTYSPLNSNDTLLYFSHAVSRHWSSIGYKIQIKAKQGSASPWVTSVRTIGEATFKRP